MPHACTPQTVKGNDVRSKSCLLYMEPALPDFCLAASLAGAAYPLLQRWADGCLQGSTVPVGGSCFPEPVLLIYPWWAWDLGGFRGEVKEPELCEELPPQPTRVGKSSGTWGLPHPLDSQQHSRSLASQFFIGMSRSSGF